MNPDNCNCNEFQKVVDYTDIRYTDLKWNTIKQDRTKHLQMLREALVTEGK